MEKAKTLRTMNRMPRRPLRFEASPSAILSSVLSISDIKAPPPSTWEQRRLFRRQHHDDLPAFETRLRFDLGYFGRILLDLLQKLKSDLLVRHFAAAETKGDLYL